MKNQTAIIGAVVVVVIGIIYFLKTTSGKSVGTEAAGVVTGFVGGVAGSVATVANDPNVNPLYDLGSSIGESVFNLFNTPYAP